MIIQTISIIVLCIQFIKGFTFSTQNPLCEATGFGNVMKLTLIVCLLCSNITHARRARGDRYTCNSGAITPRSPYFLEGQDLVLICSKNGPVEYELVFVKGRDTVIEARYVQSINDTAVRLMIPNITAADINPDTKNTHYRCYDSKQNRTRWTKKRCVADTYVKLEYYPRKAENLTIHVYNWDTMTWTWDLGDYVDNRNIRVNCKYGYTDNTYVNISYKSDHSDWMEKSNCTMTSCTWDSYQFEDAMRYGLVINVTNKKTGNYTLTEFNFSTNDYVEPAPVKSVQIENTGDPLCQNVSWIPSNIYRNFTYILTYHSVCSHKVQKTVNYQPKDKRVITRVCDLVPNTEYTYSIVGRHMYPHPRGYWSSPVNETAWTSKTVPSKSPEVTEGLYEFGEGHVTLYWKPLAECDLHGDDVNYNINYNNTVPVEHPKFYMEIDIGTPQADITLFAKNEIGPALYDTNIHISYSKQWPRQSELVMMMYNKTDICDIHAEIVVDQKHRESLVHTVVYCKGSPCQAPIGIQWVVLEPTITYLRFPDNHRQGDYRYGLITKHCDGHKCNTTGIVWSQCLYEQNKVPPESVENLHLVPEQPDRGVTVMWDKYDCDYQSYITYYILQYEVIHGDKVAGVTCKELAAANKMSSTEVGGQETSHTIDGIEVGTQLAICLQPVSSGGAGPWNEEPIYYTIAKSQESFPVWAIVLIVILCAALLLVGCCFCIRFGYKTLEAKKDNFVVKGILPPLTDEQNNQPPVRQRPPEEQPLIDGGPDSLDSDVTSPSSQQQNMEPVHDSDTPGITASRPSSSIDSGVINPLVDTFQNTHNSGESDIEMQDTESIEDTGHSGYKNARDIDIDGEYSGGIDSGGGEDSGDSGGAYSLTEQEKALSIQEPDMKVKNIESVVVVGKTTEVNMTEHEKALSIPDTDIKSIERSVVERRPKDFAAGNLDCKVVFPKCEDMDTVSVNDLLSEHGGSSCGSDGCLNDLMDHQTVNTDHKDIGTPKLPPDKTCDKTGEHQYGLDKDNHASYESPDSDDAIFRSDSSDIELDDLEMHDGYRDVIIDMEEDMSDSAADVDNDHRYIEASMLGDDEYTTKETEFNDCKDTSTEPISTDKLKKYGNIINDESQNSKISNSSEIHPCITEQSDISSNSVDCLCVNTIQKVDRPVGEDTSAESNLDIVSVSGKNGEVRINGHNSCVSGADNSGASSAAISSGEMIAPYHHVNNLDIPCMIVQPLCEKEKKDLNNKSAENKIKAKCGTDNKICISNGSLNI